MASARCIPESHDVSCGGVHGVCRCPAVQLNRDFLAGVALLEAPEKVNALPRHNPQATFTSRGCIRKCPFCAVPTLEGDLVELDDWPIKPIVCDNNLLACSTRHFDSVIDKLKTVQEVDFNQGLDARLLTPHHAERIAEPDLKFVRLAWDSTKTESRFMRAFQILREAGIAKKKIRVYILFGYDDTPEDALYRLRTVQDLGIRPNPMRYQPLKAATKNSFVGPAWTEHLLKKYARYWSRLKWFEHIPFELFDPNGKYIKPDPAQLELL